MLLVTWNFPNTRSTKDIDLLGLTSNDIESIKQIMLEILCTEVIPDGVYFQKESIDIFPIKEESLYHGVRVIIRGELANAKVHLQIDIGFNDVIYPEMQIVHYPTILDLPTPSLKGYSPESVVAEKLEAMVKLGELNSRMKDFYDVWLLTKQFSFTMENLSKAIILTFAKRDTDLIADVIAFQPSFARLKQLQWKSFINKIALENIPRDFSEVIAHLKIFFTPLLDDHIDDPSLVKNWDVKGFWK